MACEASGVLSSECAPSGLQSESERKKKPKKNTDVSCAESERPSLCQKWPHQLEWALPVCVVSAVVVERVCFVAQCFPSTPSLSKPGLHQREKKKKKKIWSTVFIVRRRLVSHTPSCLDWLCRLDLASCFGNNPLKKRMGLEKYNLKNSI